jgi:hypothetical protein
MVRICIKIQEQHYPIKETMCHEHCNKNVGNLSNITRIIRKLLLEEDQCLQGNL